MNVKRRDNNLFQSTPNPPLTDRRRGFRRSAHTGYASDTGTPPPGVASAAATSPGAAQPCAPGAPGGGEDLIALAAFGCPGDTAALVARIDQHLGDALNASTYMNIAMSGVVFAGSGSLFYCSSAEIPKVKRKGGPAPR